MGLQHEFLKTQGTVALYGLSLRRQGFAHEVLRALQAAYGEKRPGAGGRETGHMDSFAPQDDEGAQPSATPPGERPGPAYSRLIVAVHPRAGMRDIYGLKGAPSAREIQPPPQLAVIVLKPEDARKALEDAADAGIHRVWLVMNACSPANREYAQSRGMQAVGGCPLLFVDKPWFPHNIHRALAKLFGKM